MDGSLEGRSPAVNVDAAHPLYLLPFDHRASFKKGLLGLTGAPDIAQCRRVSDLKMLIWEGFTKALALGVPPEWCGVLVDEEFGADVARAAKSIGVALAMPVETSGQDEFELAYGDVFAAHIDAFDPDFVKVLVRYNPEGDPSLNARQERRLAELSEWLRARGRRLLFELLVPPTQEQTAKVGDDSRSYELRALPRLIVAAIAALQAAGVEPDNWKIQGIDDRADCERAANQARIGGRDTVACIVLGHGADATQVRHWLQVAASVAGYAGFAAGRTIWRGPLTDHIAGRTDRETAQDAVARNYLDMISTYRAAAEGTPATPDAQVAAHGSTVAPAAQGRGSRS
jgi:myo-inositol catabolism protein IolC